MLIRVEYFRDLLEDCYAATRAANVPTQDEARIIAAMIASDSYNGLRKAYLAVEANKRNANTLHVSGGQL